MIGRLRGIYVEQLLKKSKETVVIIDIGGCGYELTILDRLVQGWTPEEEVITYTYLHVREDTLKLFGFEYNQERVLFEYLMSVPGVGTRAAFALMNFFVFEDLLHILNTSDIQSLNKIDGIGPKLAKRIIIEMQGKIQDIVKKLHVEIPSITHSVGKGSAYNTTCLLLEQLGYKRSLIISVLDKLYLNKDNISLSAEDLVKLALKHLS